MSSWIQGMHHVAVKPTPQQREKTIDFYTRVLGLPVTKTFGPPERPILLLDCGDGTCIEILSRDQEAPADGALAHVALACSRENVDLLLERVRREGYPIHREPGDMEIAGIPCRNAFFFGPTGEEIELFWEEGRHA